MDWMVLLACAPEQRPAVAANVAITPPESAPFELVQPPESDDPLVYYRRLFESESSDAAFSHAFEGFERTFPRGRDRVGDFHSGQTDYHSEKVGDFELFSSTTYYNNKYCSTLGVSQLLFRERVIRVRGTGGGCHEPGLLSDLGQYEYWYDHDRGLGVRIAVGQLEPFPWRRSALGSLQSAPPVVVGAQAREYFAITDETTPRVFYENH